VIIGRPNERFVLEAVTAFRHNDKEWFVPRAVGAEIDCDVCQPLKLAAFR